MMNSTTEIHHWILYLFKTLFLGNFPGSEHEVTQEVTISILSLLNH